MPKSIKCDLWICGRCRRQQYQWAGKPTGENPKKHRSMPPNLQLNLKISYNPQKIGTSLFKKFQLCSLARHYDIYFAKSSSNLHFLNNLKNRLPDKLRSWEAVQTFKLIVFPTKMSHKSQS